MLVKKQFFSWNLKACRNHITSKMNMLSTSFVNEIYFIQQPRTLWSFSMCVGIKTNTLQFKWFVEKSLLKTTWWTKIMFVVAAVFSVLFKTLNVENALPKVSVDSEVHLKFSRKKRDQPCQTDLFFCSKDEHIFKSSARNELNSVEFNWIFKLFRLFSVESSTWLNTTENIFYVNHNDAKNFICIIWYVLQIKITL